MVYVVDAYKAYRKGTPKQKRVILTDLPYKAVEVILVTIRLAFILPLLLVGLPFTGVAFCIGCIAEFIGSCFHRLEKPIRSKRNEISRKWRSLAPPKDE